MAIFILTDGDDEFSTHDWPGANHVEARDGNDTIIGGDAPDTLIGGAGDDWFIIAFNGAYPEGRTIDGGPGLDKVSIDFGPLIGYAFSDIEILELGYGTGFLTTLADLTAVQTITSDRGPGFGINILAYGPGGYIDFSALMAPGVGVTGELRTDGAVDVLLTNADDFGFGGSPFDDRIAGLKGNDAIAGLDGNDTLDGGAGNDTLEGGDGDDQLITGGGDDLLEGQGGDDYLFSSGEDDPTLRGGEGDDLIVSNSGGRDILNGGAGDDTLAPGYGAQLALGGEGNDVLYLGGGDQTLAGGMGDDLYIVHNLRRHAPEILENPGEGTDTIESRETLKLAENVENLVLKGSAAISGYGNGGDNTMTGNSGRNILVGNKGADTLAGGGGDDHLRGGNHADVLSGGSGTDRIEGGKGEDTLLGGTGNDHLFGGGQDDRLLGEAGNDTVLGGWGNDWLSGGDGRDIVGGGRGADTLTGGAGADVFVFDTVLGRDNIDVITDFTLGEDVIHLDRAIFTALPAGPVPARAFDDGTYPYEDDFLIFFDKKSGALS